MKKFMLLALGAAMLSGCNMTRARYGDATLWDASLFKKTSVDDVAWKRDAGGAEGWEINNVARTPDEAAIAVFAEFVKETAVK